MSYVSFTGYNVAYLAMYNQSFLAIVKQEAPLHLIRQPYGKWITCTLVRVVDKIEPHTTVLKWPRNVSSRKKKIK